MGQKLDLRFILRNYINVILRVFYAKRTLFHLWYQTGRRNQNHFLSLMTPPQRKLWKQRKPNITHHWVSGGISTFGFHSDFFLIGYFIITNQIGGGQSKILQTAHFYTTRIFAADWQNFLN